MTQPVFPAFENEDVGRADLAGGTPCLNCKKIINDRTYPQMVRFSLGTVVMNPDGTGVGTDELCSCVFFMLQDFSADLGVSLVLAKDIRGGDTDFCFCSVACCRAWLNQALDALERKATQDGFMRAGAS
jgi:hypothetical protein